MASIYRASSLWEDYPKITTGRTSYFPDEAVDDDDDEGDDLEEQRLVEELEECDGRTALDKTIDRIGMGSYQWTLLSLCGFGWMADNMWIQTVAIILPRVQQHYDVPDSYIGIVSSSMFAGMMFGAVGWGTCSDLMGRSTAFNATLFFTSVFGILASFVNSFPSLCVVLFFLGSAVGGSMPTDGTLLLEHMPKGKQHLVTALSVFFSFGAVLSAIVALLIVPSNSCPSSAISSVPGSNQIALPCNVDTQNQGWKYMLIVLGIITLTMFIARIVFFRLHESPRYLVHAGRPQEALVSLQLISRFNGDELDIEIDDVDDRPPTMEDGTPCSAIPVTNDSNSATIFDASESSKKDYQSIGESPNSLDAYSPMPTPAGTVFVDELTAAQNLAVRSGYVNPTPATLEFKDLPHVVTSPIPSSLSFSALNSAVTPEPAPAPRSPITPKSRSQSRRRMSRASTARRYSTASMYDKARFGASFPRWLRKPLWAWLDRIGTVLGPKWLRTTLLIWAIWCSMSLAYTMFNVFLPKLLEALPAATAEVGEKKTLEDSLWDIVIFTIAGCPGAILGAYMVDSRLGRRWSLASSTFVTAFFCIVFALVSSPMAVRVSTVGISLSATTMWAVLYGWTPEIFDTEVRGSACGIASALSRIGGMIAPMLGGTLLMIDRTVPVYTSVVIFVIAGVCVLFLKEDNTGGDKGNRERVIIH